MKGNSLLVMGFVLLAISFFSPDSPAGIPMKNDARLSIFKMSPQAKHKLLSTANLASFVPAEFHC